MASRLHSSDSNSTAVHTFENEEGEEYKASNFGGFGDYFRRKKIKLQNLDAELRSTTQDKPRIFAGVVAFVNGYTQPSLNDLHKLIVTHGGGFLQYLDGRTAVTHIIASSLTPKKRVEFRRYRIVKPAWVVDSVNAGRLLPWDSYRVVDEGSDQKVLGLNDGRVVSQVNNHRTGYKDQTDGSWYTKQIIRSGRIADEGSTQTEAEPLEAQEDNDLEIEGSAEQNKAPTRGAARPDQNLPDHDVTSSGMAELVELASDTRFPETAAAYKSIPQTRLAAESDSDQAVESPHIGFLNDPSPSQVDAFELETPPTDTHPASKEPSPRRTHSPHSTVVSEKVPKTAEEHNSVLLADPYYRKASAVNPNFIKQYYAESRLHHLSTWKANLKAQLHRMTAEQSPSQQAAYKRSPGTRRYILHLDFDSFFASVSLKSAPHYKDKPVVVAHGTGAGSEIASCNYPAREHGVKNGMWMKNALKLCPDLKVLPYDFEAYEQASKDFYRAIIDSGGVVQSVSVDEALLDITAFCLSAGENNSEGVQESSVWREQEKAGEIAASLRRTIHERTGCTVSVGIGGNILLAKLALRKAKPAGLFLLEPENVLDFLAELNVQSLPGVSYSIGSKLEEHGIKLVKDVRALSKEKLMSILGPKTGEKLHQYSRGIDGTEVGAQVERKSVSAEVNWGIRFESHAQAEIFMNSLCQELHERLKEVKVKARQLTLKVMKRAADAPLEPPKHLGHGKCDVFNKSVMLGVATNSQEVLAKESLSMLKSFGFSPGELRGIGLQTTKLEPLKATRDEDIESSQRKLMFGVARSGDGHDTSAGLVEERRGTLQTVVTTPRGSRSAHDEPLERPSHMLATQFALPTQVDPTVLAELPADIRVKLLRAAQDGPSEARSATRAEPRRLSPMNWSGAAPTLSQLDPDILAALPPELRDEVLEVHQKAPAGRHNQSLLPQSPRKARPFATPLRKSTTPRKKRTALFAHGKAAADSYSTLTQSNFVTTSNTVGESSSKMTDDSNTLGAKDVPDVDSEEISPDFLAALPEELRKEVLAEHRRERLSIGGRLDMPNPAGVYSARQPHPPPQPQPQPAAAPNNQRRLALPPRPSKATFSTQRLSTLPELRDAISRWVVEFADDGPYDDDVDALARYVGKIIRDGRDLDKAVAVVKWLDWIRSDDDHGVRGDGVSGWTKAVERICGAVQDAVRARGLGPVDLGFAR
ncbi:MAG: deoxycytidyl transferase [Lichina confinis]|nr:MAG: deoxycytidyl transferase [Lichina confinis]